MYFVEFDAFNDPDKDATFKVVVDIEKMRSYSPWREGITYIAFDDDWGFYIAVDYEDFKRCMREWGRGHHAFDPQTGVIRTIKDE